MNKISYSGYRFPPEIIQQAIWLYLRFTLSLQDVEELLAERGVAVSDETVRRAMAARVTDELTHETERPTNFFANAWVREWRLMLAQDVGAFPTGAAGYPSIIN